MGVQVRVDGQTTSPFGMRAVQMGARKAQSDDCKATISPKVRARPKAVITISFPFKDKYKNENFSSLYMIENRAS